MGERIELIMGDITKLEVDAIVNAANSSLLGGGGVDGAIHRAAGSGLAEACSRLGGCKTGDAKTTAGFNLAARFVIHAVGPLWGGGNSHEEELLALCYRNALVQATLHACRTVAFPNISTGIYRFPKELASKIAIREVKKYLSAAAMPEKVIFVSFDAENFALYEEMLNK